MSNIIGAAARITHVYPTKKKMDPLPKEDADQQDDEEGEENGCSAVELQHGHSASRMHAKVGKGKSSG